MTDLALVAEAAPTRSPRIGRVFVRGFGAKGGLLSVEGDNLVLDNDKGQRVFSLHRDEIARFKRWSWARDNMELRLVSGEVIRLTGRSLNLWVGLIFASYYPAHALFGGAAGTGGVAQRAAIITLGYGAATLIWMLAGRRQVKAASDGIQAWLER